MTNAKLHAQRQTLLHYWTNRTRSPIILHKKTKIPLRTIERNIKKLKEIGTVERKRGNGRTSKITRKVAVVIVQYVRRDIAISTRQLAIKVQETQGETISHQTIWRHMKRKEYENSIPRGTPMLENRHIEARKKLAEEHKNENWNCSNFTD